MRSKKTCRSRSRSKSKRISRKRQGTRKQNQRGGSYIPDWVPAYLVKAMELQQLAFTMDSKHTFLISGSVAILMYLHELVTVDHSALTEAELQDCLRFLQTLPKPNDLDFKYMEDSETLFDMQVRHDPTKQASMYNTVSIASCPSFVEFDIYRACMPMAKDISFEQRTPSAALFDTVDFTQVKKARRSRKPVAYKAILSDSVIVMGVANMYEFYRENEREDGSDRIKLAALDRIRTVLSGNSMLAQKYNGVRMEVREDDAWGM